MARIGLTNFVVWALATVLLGYFLASSGESYVLVPAAASFAVAWWTRFWPEGLGVAAGVAVISLISALERTSCLAGECTPGSGFYLVAAATVATGVYVTWRHRVGRPAPAVGPAPGVPSRPPPAPLRNGTSTSPRLAVATFVGALAILVVNFFFTLGFGFTCQSDTSHATPGSDRAAWCDALGSEVGLLVLFGPPALALLAGWVAASHRKSRGVLVAVLVGVGLAIAVHVPDFVLSNAAP